MARFEKWFAAVVLAAASLPAGFLALFFAGLSLLRAVRGDWEALGGIAIAALFGAPVVAGWFWWRRGVYVVAMGCGLLLAGVLALLWSGLNAIMGFD